MHVIVQMHVHMFVSVHVSMYAYLYVQVQAPYVHGEDKGLLWGHSLAADHPFF